MRECHNMRRSRKFCQGRGGPTVTFCSWWGEGGSKYHYKRAIIGPPAKCHLNGFSLVCWWRPNIECWLDSFVIFRGSRPVLLRNPTFLWFFRGGGVRTPCPPSGSAHAQWNYAFPNYPEEEELLRTEIPKMWVLLIRKLSRGFIFAKLRGCRVSRK